MHYRYKFFALLQNIILYIWLVYSVLFAGMTEGNFVLYIEIIKAFSENIVQVFDSWADMKIASLEMLIIVLP